MLAVGVMPGVAALVLFWWPPFLVFGLFSLAVMVSAFVWASCAGQRESGVRSCSAEPRFWPRGDNLATPIDHTTSAGWPLGESAPRQ